MDTITRDVKCHNVELRFLHTTGFCSKICHPEQTDARPGETQTLAWALSYQRHPLTASFPGTGWAPVKSCLHLFSFHPILSPSLHYASTGLSPGLPCFLGKLRPTLFPSHLSHDFSKNHVSYSFFPIQIPYCPFCFHLWCLCISRYAVIILKMCVHHLPEKD